MSNFPTTVFHMGGREATLKPADTRVTTPPRRALDDIKIVEGPLPKPVRKRGYWAEVAMRIPEGMSAVVADNNERNKLYDACRRLKYKTKSLQLKDGTFQIQIISKPKESK